MYVIGTAGHVDHGKSALVKALTGIDPDRLEEEKERGMTIDLGFAWLKLPSGREVSIVDVPGHERFVKNMLAGVGGIDLALLVIAADEGVMPQTREHLAILDLLQIKSGLVVIAKKDLVDDEWLELVTSDIEDVIKETSLEGAPIVATSSVTGEGLQDLLITIDRLLEATPQKKDIGKPRLPVDRVFTMAGFGTVVTGTLIDGHLSVGQEVQVVPGDLRTRIRGLQTHRQKVERAEPGSRVAVNLSGVATDQLERGQVLTTPGWLKPTSALDAKLRLIKDAPAALKHNATVTFHTGSSETVAKARLLEKEELSPGETTWAQLRLDKPIATVKGDFFVIRTSWGTIGGGQIVDPFAKRHRRFHAPTVESLTTMERGSPQDVLLGIVEQIEPCEVARLLDRSNLNRDESIAALEALSSDSRIVVLGELGPNVVLFSARGWGRLQQKTRETLQVYHRQYPLRSGIPKEELKSRLRLATPVFNGALQHLAQEGVLVEGEATARLPSHEVMLTQAQQSEVAAFLRALEQEPYSPPGDRLPEPEVLNMLIEQGKVVRVADNIVFSATAYETMVRRITERIKSQGKITVAEVRDLFNTSRKYALSLMEYLDQQRVTRRVGDERVLR